jgi:hypothetical protein
LLIWEGGLRVVTGANHNVNLGEVRCPFTSKRDVQVKHKEVTESKFHVAQESLDVFGYKLDGLGRALAS